nr:MAG TPA: hypothetical protein [Caudoviricetes sp.]
MTGYCFECCRRDPTDITCQIRQNLQSRHIRFR